MAFDQDAVDQVMALLKPELDQMRADIQGLKDALAQIPGGPVGMLPDTIVQTFPDGTSETWKIVKETA